MKLRKPYSNSNSVSVVIPREIMRILRWAAGDEVEVIREGPRVVVQKNEDFEK
jgi:bifunctional DNA-binding transcriptional regulator/antitoxin component of YhaV-PrlF toxin-antitoxin module